MEDEYPTLLHRWFGEVWNNQNEAVIDEMMAEDVVVHGLGDTAIIGRKAFKGFYEAFRNAFPDIVVTVDEVIQDGEKIAGRVTVRGSHMGDTLGFAATNRPTHFTGIGLCTVRDGKFIEVWNEFNFMKMHADLGTIAT